MGAEGPVAASLNPSAGEEPIFTDVSRTELVWPGKYDEQGRRREVPRVTLPFQVIETINESRAIGKARAEEQPTLFDVYEGTEGETLEEGWRNKLIWGDNLLVMSSLLARFAGKVDLIYIDPPFATGADFRFTTTVGEAGLELSKEQSIIEEKAYRDTWGRGSGSFLQMLHSRFVFMHELLSDSGAIYVHCDHRASHYIRAVMEEVFGPKNFLNHLIWTFSTRSSIKSTWKRSHHDIFLFKKHANPVFNWNDEMVLEPLSESTIKKYRYEDEVGRYRLSGRNIKGSPIRSAKDVDPSWEETHPELVVRDYLREGKVPSDYFFIPIENQAALVRTGFPTQKPEELLYKLISASTRPGDLVADFFSGSGTTSAVAEKLARRWIACDLSRWAVHVNRKRLLQIENCSPFEVLNLGRYERKYWQVATFGEDLDKDGQIALYEYLAFILKLYGGEPLSGSQHLHGRRQGAVIHIGAVDAPVTIDEITQAIDECVAMKQNELHILGWEWEMGLAGPDDGERPGGLMHEIAKKRGVKLLLRHIPREVMEEQAVDRGDIRFFELAYLDVAIDRKKRDVTVTLMDFVIPSTELIPEDVREKIEKWSDYVDYWAVDWDFQNDTFIQGWVDYRTRADRSLTLTTKTHRYEASGTYRILVKVVDIFGNDTSQAYDIEVP